ncbi:hypothetical protein NMG60_11004739 [Bertholletia excelsa]
MVTLCFVLDLRSLSPSLLRDLKQSLLQLANFYAVLAPVGEKQRLKSLSDRISLCYVLRNRISCSDELKVAYRPRESFSLRDFHYAVNNLPTDAFLPGFNESGALSFVQADVKLTSILSNEVLYSRGGHEKDIARKVILIRSHVVENLDSVKRDILMDAADNCVSVEFLLLEQETSPVQDFSQKISDFMQHISDLENCSFHAYLPDTEVLNCLVKRWLQELKDDICEPLQAHLIFKSNIFNSVGLISCNLSASTTQIIDEFSPCQTCRCHGIPLRDGFGKQFKRASICPVTGSDLETSDLIENFVEVGEQMILHLPSFQNCENLERVSLPVDLNIIERTNLGSLSEGVILGTAFIVTPSAFHEPDDMRNLEQNTQRASHVFQGLCSVLYSLDQGLICSSKCNIETVRETLFHCYYILLPSANGLMLLKRLAGSEEILPLPDVNQLSCSSTTIEIENSIRDFLQKIEIRDYNPLLHERGLHQKLNLLVKESLQSGSKDFNLKRVDSEPSSTKCVSSEDTMPPTANVVVIDEEITEVDLTVEDDLDSARTAEEWERMIVNEASKTHSPSCISKAKFDQLLSPQGSSRQLDEKTTKILERLEVPRQMKRKSPLVKTSSTADACVQNKAPLIPFQPIEGTDQGKMSSQPMKPNFQKLRRKQK